MSFLISFCSNIKHHLTIIHLKCFTDYLYNVLVLKDEKKYFDLKTG